MTDPRGRDRLALLGRRLAVWPWFLLILAGGLVVAGLLTLDEADPPLEHPTAIREIAAFTVLGPDDVIDESVHSRVTASPIADEGEIDPESLIQIPAFLTLVEPVPIVVEVEPDQALGGALRVGDSVRVRFRLDSDFEAAGLVVEVTAVERTADAEATERSTYLVTLLINGAQREPMALLIDAGRAPLLFRD